MNKNNSVMYSSEKVERTLNDTFLTEPLRNSRKKELSFLQEKMISACKEFKMPLKILDIGIGDGFVPLHLNAELWSNIQSYSGIDNSVVELKKCKENIDKAGLSNKVRVYELDATNLTDKKGLPIHLHLIICTYFTPGNFKPDEISLEINTSGKMKRYPKEVLKPNKKFQKVFLESYKLLCERGKLILGSVYIDSKETRIKQEEFYKNCGMTVITTDEDDFTATKEGFWSERFTDEKIYSYLDWINPENIQLIPLDGDNFAKMVIITKGD